MSGTRQIPRQLDVTLDVATIEAVIEEYTTPGIVAHFLRTRLAIQAALARRAYAEAATLQLEAADSVYRWAREYVAHVDRLRSERAQAQRAG